MSNLLTSKQHADIFKSGQNKQSQAFQEMEHFINNPDLVS